MKKAFLYLCWIVTFCAACASCKPSLPRDVLSKGKMTDILFDYHIALAMAQSEDGGSEKNSLAYREAVLKKHDVTSADFDSSMVYYMRHTELLHDVYKDLAERLDKEVVALGGNSAGNSDFDNLTAVGDTANIWKDATSMVFSPDEGFNSRSFKIEADTAFHKGDRFRLDFESQFIFQDGMRDGIALLAVQFKNDSVAQTVVHIQSAQHYSVELADNDSLGIKCIKGYFMLNEGGFSSDAGSLTTLKLMFVNKIRLIRMHPKKVAPVSSSAASSDSAKVDTARKTRIPGPSVPARPDGALAPPTSAPVPMPDKPIQMTSN